ncbi:MAG: hypothetical protein AAGA39_10825 [Pseudomonadota bacterium]
MVDQRQIEMLTSRVTDARGKALETSTKAKQSEKSVKAFRGNLKGLEVRAKKIKASSKSLAEIPKVLKTYVVKSTRLTKMSTEAKSAQTAREKDMRQLITGFQKLEALRDKEDEKSKAKVEKMEPEIEALADKITKGLRSVGSKYEKGRALDKELHDIATELLILESKTDAEIAEAEKTAKKK